MPVEGTPRLYSTTMIGDDLWVGTAQGVYVRAPDGSWSQPEWTPMFERPNALLQIARDDDGAYWLGSQRRSEEHTSELQSLMRISYAVFCLKKKKRIQQDQNQLQH